MEGGNLMEATEPSLSTERKDHAPAEEHVGLQIYEKNDAEFI
jgi:hypothetical protein